MDPQIRFWLIENDRSVHEPQTNNIFAHNVQQKIKF